MFKNIWIAFCKQQFSLKRHTELLKEGRGDLHSEQRIPYWNTALCSRKEACSSTFSIYSLFCFMWRNPSVLMSGFARGNRAYLLFLRDTKTWATLGKMPLNLTSSMHLVHLTGRPLPGLWHQALCGICCRDLSIYRGSISENWSWQTCWRVRHDQSVANTYKLWLL